MNSPTARSGQPATNNLAVADITQPATHRLSYCWDSNPGPRPYQGRTLPTELQQRMSERVMGIEPTWPAWKAGTLPLSYTRVCESAAADSSLLPKTSLTEVSSILKATLKPARLENNTPVGHVHPANRVGAAGFEPAKALPPDLQSGPIGRSGTPPTSRRRKALATTNLRTELAVGVEPTTAGLQNRSSAIEPR